MVVLFLLGFAAGNLDFGRVDYDDVVTGVHVGGEYWLVLSTDYASNLGGKPAQNLALGVHYIPVMLDVPRSRGEGLHTIIVFARSFDLQQPTNLAYSSSMSNAPLSTAV